MMNNNDLMCYMEYNMLICCELLFFLRNQY